MDAVARTRQSEVEHRAARARELYGSGTIHLGIAGGVVYELDWSVPAVLGLVVVQGERIVRAWHPEWSESLAWSVAALGGLLLFASIAVHELAHVVAARAWGVPVRRVTMHAFGGISRLEREPPSPRAELVVATVGPLASLVLGLAAAALFCFLSGHHILELATDPVGVAWDHNPLTTLIVWLAPVNLALAGLNLVPAFPLDGGRALRAILWHRTGDVLGATRRAIAVGTASGLVIVAAGVAVVAAGHFAEGVSTVLAGWLLRSAARTAHDSLVADHCLEQLRVSRLMRRGVAVLAPHATLEDLVDAFLAQHGDQLAFPVVSGDRLLGLVRLADLGSVPREAWAGTVVEAAMTPLDELVTIRAGAPATDALELLTLHQLDQVPVVDDGRLRGLVQRREILAWLGTTRTSFPG